ncbi:hypothetical protein GEMRC1_007716 [Eukaryota sp. GEM-RC1]
MKLWELQACLQQVAGFDTPKVRLEQYITPNDIAATILHTAELSYGDISSKSVLDLGCGTGMLSIAASILGAENVHSFDIDEDALTIARSNAINLEIDNITFHNADVLELDLQQKFDTVLLNPPFGTKHNAGIDVAFLKKAIEFSSNSVYSLHKTSTREYLIRTIKSLGLEVEVLATIKYDLPKTMKFHKKRNEVIEVDLLRVQM